VAEIRATVDEGGGAILDLAGGGEIRDSVALDEVEAADCVPALGSLVLHFDFYGALGADRGDRFGRFRPAADADRSREIVSPAASRTQHKCGQLRPPQHM